MNIYKNEKLINRNTKIGQFSSLFALLILLGGMATTFIAPEQFAISMSALLVGFILSQVGIYYGNRWGRKPRVDEKIDQSLKGLGKEYSLYHYTTPASHLLVGPAGVWILLPYHQKGTISYDGKRWRQSGGGFFQGYLRLFAQEGIGRPDLESEAEIKGLTRYLGKKLNQEDIPPIQSLLIFTDERADLQTENAPLLVLPAKKLKDFIRKQAKEISLPSAQLSTVKSALEKK